jgi:hypothetical protein
MNQQNKLKRLKIANKFIKIISFYGRRFFYSKRNNKIAFLKMKNNCIYYVSEFSGKEIYLHYKYWTFHHGGTLRYLINELKEYIMGRCNEYLLLSLLGPWRKEICGGDLWGYGDDMKEVRKECRKLFE